MYKWYHYNRIYCEPIYKTVYFLERVRLKISDSVYGFIYGRLL